MEPKSANIKRIPPYLQHQATNLKCRNFNLDMHESTCRRPESTTVNHRGGSLVSVSRRGNTIEDASSSEMSPRFHPTLRISICNYILPPEISFRNREPQFLPPTYPTWTKHPNNFALVLGKLGGAHPTCVRTVYMNAAERRALTQCTVARDCHMLPQVRVFPVGPQDPMTRYVDPFILAKLSRNPAATF